MNEWMKRSNYSDRLRVELFYIIIPYARTCLLNQCGCLLSSVMNKHILHIRRGEIENLIYFNTFVFPKDWQLIHFF